MNYELLQLILLLNKDRYNKYNSLINEKELKENTKELYYIYQCIKELHSLYEKDIELKELQAFFYAKYPNASKDAAYDALFSQADLHAAMDGAMAELVLSKVRERRLSLNISEAAYNLAQGIGTQEQLSTLFKELDDTHASPLASGYEAESLDLDALITSSYNKPGIRWRLDFLNKSLGSLRSGDFGMLIKRPEAGGTLFAADVASNALDQVDSPVIWFNSEEANNKVLLRVYQSYFGVSLQQLIGNAGYYKEEFLRKNKGKFLFFGLERCNKADTEAIIREHKPALVLYDQISKTKGFDADRLDLQLGDIFQWARELAKEGHAGVAIHQADGTAEGQKWLGMQHVANAKTAIQAECDWILGMGHTSDPNEEAIRFLSISKNKLLGDEDSIPELRHGRTEVLIQKDIMRLKDIINEYV